MLTHGSTYDNVWGIQMENLELRGIRIVWECDMLRARAMCWSLPSGQKDGHQFVLFLI